MGEGRIPRGKSRSSTPSVANGSKFNSISSFKEIYQNSTKIPWNEEALGFVISDLIFYTLGNKK